VLRCLSATSLGRVACFGGSSSLRSERIAQLYSVAVDSLRFPQAWPQHSGVRRQALSWLLHLPGASWRQAIREQRLGTYLPGPRPSYL